MKLARTREPKLNKGLSFGTRACTDIRRNYSLYLMFLPVIAFYIIFNYIPMYGATVAFRRFNLTNAHLGMFGAPWVGLENFRTFFQSAYFGRIFFNTLNISVQTLIFGFPMPIILALLINELRNKSFTRTVQTISYLPHFISLVVICGMIIDFT